MLTKADIASIRNARHMAVMPTIPANVVHFPGRPPRACYVPPPADSEVSNSDLEFSDLGRDPLGWAGIVCVLAAIFGPMIIAVELFR